MIYLTGGKIQISVNKILWLHPDSTPLLKYYLPKIDLKIKPSVFLGQDDPKIRWEYPYAHILLCFPSYIVWM